MQMQMPRGGGSARSAILTFGAVAGTVWLITFLSALLLRADPAGRAMTTGLAGVTTVLMLVFVLPVMICAWRGWWRGVALSLTGGVLAVAALIVFASA